MSVHTKGVSSTIARDQNGTVTITFIIPYSVVLVEEKKVLTELSSDIAVAGFRKGYAPLDLVRSQVSDSTLTEKILFKILPKALQEAIKSYKLRLAIYPKFEIVSGKPNETWQIRGITCELPQINLGNYKERLTVNKKKNIVTKPLTSEEKQQEVIKILLDSTNVPVPKLLLESEVNSRLARLLERIEKLGLSIESYLSSIGKSAEVLRSEYTKEAEKSIILDLVLSKIAQEEKIEADPKELENVLKTTNSTDPNQKMLIETMLTKRTTLDSLAALI